jgi:hypothetical protein
VPEEYVRTLKPGPHGFEVLAIEAGGNHDHGGFLHEAVVDSQPTSIGFWDSCRITHRCTDGTTVNRSVVPER